MNRLYYSTQTRLLYRLATEFYADEFYVYVAEVFDPPTNPPSSNPKAIYTEWRQIAAQFGKLTRTEVDRVKQHQFTLKRIASVKTGKRQISNDAYGAIQWIVENATAEDFMPILFLIVRENVQGRVQDVPEDKLPMPESVEFILPDLERGEFETVEGI